MINGIDVSRWQGSIDWRAVRAAGYDFAFIKATEGATWTDPNFVQNRNAAREVGIASGAYHFFRATSKVEAQVDHFVQTVGQLHKGELPPVLDVEDPAQWKGVSRADLTALVVQWLANVEKRLGARPFVYVSPSFVSELLESSTTLGGYPLWIAHWTDNQPTVPKPWNEWTFWQYSSKGKVDGITENVVDLDRFNGDRSEFESMLR